MCVFAGLVNDPFFMDVQAAIRTNITGKLSFGTATSTVELRDVLAIVVEIPFAPIVTRFNGATLIAAISETIVTCRGNPSDSSALGGRRSGTSSRSTRLAIRARRASNFATSATAKTPLRSPRRIGPATSRASMPTWPSSMVWTARPRGRSQQTGAIRYAICSSTIS